MFTARRQFFGERCPRFLPLKCKNFSLTSNVLDWPFVSDEQFGLDVLDVPLSSVVFPRESLILSQ